MEILPAQVSSLESARASIFVTNFVAVSIIHFSTVNTLEILTIHLDYPVHIVRTSLHVFLLGSALCELHITVETTVVPYLEMHCPVVHSKCVLVVVTSEYSSADRAAHAF